MRRAWRWMIGFIRNLRDFRPAVDFDGKVRCFCHYCCEDRYKRRRKAKALP